MRGKFSNHITFTLSVTVPEVAQVRSIKLNCEWVTKMHVKLTKNMLHLKSNSLWQHFPKLLPLAYSMSQG